MEVHYCICSVHISLVELLTYRKPSHQSYALTMGGTRELERVYIKFLSKSFDDC